LVTDKLKFYTGLGMLAVFAVLLTLMFTPIFDGKNALQYLDELYNSLSKGSAYFIPELQEESLEYIGISTDVIIEMESEEQAEQTAMLYEEAGAEVVILGVELEVKGDLGQILGTSLDDADAMHFNDADYNWWVSLEETNKALEDQNTFDDAKFVRSVNEKGIEPAYNYFGIEPDSVSSRIGVVIFSLVFYVIYTVWYGFALMFIVEGLGLKIRQMFLFRFVARVKL